MPDKYEGIKTQLFGVEIECTGLTRYTAAKAAGKILGNPPVRHSGRQDYYTVTDVKGRTWQFVYDGSIQRKRTDASYASKNYSVELVTPILQYEDIPILQEVIKAVRLAGGICNSSTGIHVHVDAKPYDAQKLRNLVNIFASREDMLFKALGVAPSRADSYCKKVDRDFLIELNKLKPKDMETLKHLWYQDEREYHSHYHSSRYRALNLHPVFTDHNFEVRAFNSVLDEVALRAYIILVLAVSNQALTQKTASPRPLVSDNPRYSFRVWLIRMGLNGEEFRDVRRCLLERMEGTIAWRHPEDLIAQRERIRQERIAALERSEIENPETNMNDSEPDFDEEDAYTLIP